MQKFKNKTIIKKEKYLSINPFQTKKQGEILAKKILKFLPKKKAIIIGLEGDLGGGKTTFLQGFAKKLGIKEKILSPTFVIMKKIKIQHPTSNIQYLIHIDCYRIKKPQEILDLGFKKIISNPQNIVVIEWADRIKKNIPSKSIWIKFNFINKKTREIVII